MILVKNLYLRYNKEYYTLNNINFEVLDNEKVVLFGEKESGKSSLIRIIAGLEKPTKGNVYLNNVDIEKVDFKNDFNLGYIGSTGVFLEGKTVRQNLEYVLKIRKELKEVITSKVANALIKYDMENIADTKVKNLGKFERLKLSIARLSLRKVDLFLIDDLYDNLTKKQVDDVVYYINDLINLDNVTSMVAVSDSEIAKKFKGRQIKIKFGSLE